MSLKYPILSPKGKSTKRRIYKNISISLKKFDLIENGDRLLFGFSGGKDSFTLLDYLIYLKESVPLNISITPVLINMDFPIKEIDEVKVFLNKKYNCNLIVRTTSISTAVEERMTNHKNACVLCSRLRRGFLYEMAREGDYNKLVLAHNGDDVIETFMMNIFYNSKIKGMPPKFLNNSKDVILIRPLYYVFEKDIEFYSKEMDFPVMKSSCPLIKYRGNKRVMMKKMFDKLEIDFDRVRNNTIKSMEKIDKRFLP